MISMPLHRHLCLTLPLAALVVTAPAQPQESGASEAEQIAEEYLTAYFHGDAQVAAALTHPDTLELVRTSFLEELRTATSPTGEPVTPADFGFSLSMRELSALDAEALYVEVLQAERGRDPAFAEAMSQAAVEVTSSNEAPGDATIVRLRIVTPAAGGRSSTQDAGLLLRRSGSQWRVVGNAP